jgi:hypothetical protein
MRVRPTRRIGFSGIGFASGLFETAHSWVQAPQKYDVVTSVP